MTAAAPIGGSSHWRWLRNRTRRLAWMVLPLIAAVGAFVHMVPPAVAAARLSVTSPVANIRSGPGAAYDVLWQVEQYHPMVVIQKSGSWYQFRDYQGDTGYVHGSLVGPQETVITTQDKCNVRSGPGTQHPVVFTVGEGIPFKVIENKHNWLRIEHADGDGGWIYRSLVW